MYLVLFAVIPKNRNDTEMPVIFRRFFCFFSDVNTDLGAGFGYCKNLGFRCLCLFSVSVSVSALHHRYLTPGGIVSQVATSDEHNSPVDRIRFVRDACEVFR